MKKDNKTKKEEKLTFSTIEILLMVIMVALVAVSAITVVSITTRKQNETNIKNEAEVIISQAKNAYAAFFISGKNEYIVEADDGMTRGMCITLDGLYENGYSTNEYKDKDGYVVIEEGPNHDYHYAIWYTNKKLVIEG